MVEMEVNPTRRRLLSRLALLPVAATVSACGGGSPSDGSAANVQMRVATGAAPGAPARTQPGLIAEPAQTVDVMARGSLLAVGRVPRGGHAVVWQTIDDGTGHAWSLWVQPYGADGTKSGDKTMLLSSTMAPARPSPRRSGPVCRGVRGREQCTFSLQPVVQPCGPGCGTGVTSAQHSRLRHRARRRNLRGSPVRSSALRQARAWVGDELSDPRNAPDRRCPGAARDGARVDAGRHGDGTTVPGSMTSSRAASFAVLKAPCARQASAPPSPPCASATAWPAAASGSGAT
jgi:hypothetical protein